MLNSWVVGGRINETTIGQRLSLAHPNPTTMKSCHWYHPIPISPIWMSSINFRSSRFSWKRSRTYSLVQHPGFSLVDRIENSNEKGIVSISVCMAEISTRAGAIIAEVFALDEWILLSFRHRGDLDMLMIAIVCIFTLLMCETKNNADRCFVEQRFVKTFKILMISRLAMKRGRSSGVSANEREQSNHAMRSLTSVVSNVECIDRTALRCCSHG